MANTNFRPATVAEVAARAIAEPGSFDRSVREFLDHWQSLSSAERADSIQQEPRSIGAVQDSYLAALAEHLALSARLAVPEWTETSRRFLSEPFFAGGLESLKATLIVESPAAFRRRLIFISANALDRPVRAEPSSSSRLRS